jgi:hypothetical protein
VRGSNVLTIFFCTLPEKAFAFSWGISVFAIPSFDGDKYFIKFKLTTSQRKNNEVLSG